MDASKIISAITEHEFHDQYKQLHWTGTLKEYLNMVIERPAIARTAFQRVYDMIAGYGYETYNEYKKELYHWKFFDDPFENGRDAVFGLDVALLQRAVLEPLLGIGDVRSDKRIDFVGGARGTKALEGAVDSGKAAVAFSLFPVSIDDLMVISDTGGIMPPKSTWFEPKLRDGLLVHTI